MTLEAWLAAWHPPEQAASFAIVMRHIQHETVSDTAHCLSPRIGYLSISFDLYQLIQTSVSLAAQVSGEKEFFANLVVDAVSRLDIKTLDLRMVGMKKVQVRWGCAPRGGASGAGSHLRALLG